MTPAEQLYPGRAALQVQTDLAWHLLLHRDTPMEERAHAKCFLTYRAVDGLLSLPEWAERVQGIAIRLDDPCVRTRWQGSQTTAEFYLRVLHENRVTDPWEGRTSSELSGLTAMHPAWLVNWLRMRVVQCYDALLRGSLTGAMITETLRFALRELGGIPFATQPLRVFELRDDWHALTALVLIGQRHGCLQPCDAPWASPAMITRDDGHLPYVRCLLHLGTLNASFDRLW